MIKLLGVILMTLAMLLVLTVYEDHSEEGHLTSVARVYDFPVVDIAQVDARGIVALGQGNAVGVVVIAQLGWGVVTFAQGGAGLLFGLGQAMVGLIAIAMLPLGLLFPILSFKRWEAMQAEMSALCAFKLAIDLEPKPSVVEHEADSDASRFDASGWHTALRERAIGLRREQTLALDQGALRVESGRVTFEPSTTSPEAFGGIAPAARTIARGEDVFIQWSRSWRQRPRGFWARLFGQRAFDHFLHVELRDRGGWRLRMRAEAPAALLQGLPHLEQSGQEVATDALLGLLGTLSSMGVGVVRATQARDIEVNEVPVPMSQRLHHVLQRLVRVPVKLIYLFPLLLIPKAVLRIMENPDGAWITVAYAGLLVAFFGLAALFVFSWFLKLPAAAHKP